MKWALHFKNMHQMLEILDSVQNVKELFSKRIQVGTTVFKNPQAWEERGDV